jgi:hypothetical protein
VLYVTELLGLLCIYAGYRKNVSAKQTVGVSRGEGVSRSSALPASARAAQ